ncbi:hypothetical protein [Spirosoma sp. KNUC1025]|uniref:hypothetical protein n=1 Tax=Spirosoma sp. KNUC1025 TaxID=2894082 RepID=UPI0038631858|nr:hypothetical protein LN737_16835 [Spirosoma sp. KNUC1025]
MQQMFKQKFKKNAAPTTGPSSDYSYLNYRVASPYKPDLSDSIPAFLRTKKRYTTANVFFRLCSQRSFIWKQT